MATASFVQEGDYLDYTPASAVTAGQIIVHNDMLVVAPDAIAAGVKGAVRHNGVWTFPAIDTAPFDFGVDLYWDESASKLTTDSDSGANLYAGKCAKAKATATATADCLLLQERDTAAAHPSTHAY